MRRRVTTSEHRRIRYEAPGPWPTELPPTHNDLYVQTFTNDLVTSSNNGPEIRIKGLKGRAVHDIGGNFLCYRRFYDEWSTLGAGPKHFTRFSLPTSGGRPHYETEQVAWKLAFSNTDFPIVTPSSLSVMNARAATAISRISPTKPEADLSSFLGEMREGLPHAVLIRDSAKERVARARNAGDEYLNVEFGWKPLVRDLRKFAHNVIESDKILSSYKRGSGVLLKRRYQFPIETDRQEEVIGNRYPQPILATSLYGTSPQGVLTKTTTSETKQWLVATFVYHVPDFESDRFGKYRSDAQKLLGANLTPEMVWNLTPWSWAADYFGNAGDLASNLTSFATDNLVMPYVYMMEQKTVQHEYVLNGHGTTMYQTYPGKHYFRQVFKTVTKQRVQGTPYGFGLNWSDFTSRQAGILAALGISKST